MGLAPSWKRAVRKKVCSAPSSALFHLPPFSYTTTASSRVGAGRGGGGGVERTMGKRPAGSCLPGGVAVSWCPACSKAPVLICLLQGSFVIPLEKVLSD